MWTAATAVAGSGSEPSHDSREVHRQLIDRIRDFPFHAGCLVAATPPENIYVR